VTGLGQVSRLSLAVIIDDQHVPRKAAADGPPGSTNKPWDQAEIQRSARPRVRGGVGLDTKRGDQLTIENMLVRSAGDEPEPAAPGVGSQIMTGVKNYWPSALRGLAILGLGPLHPRGHSASACAPATAVRHGVAARAGRCRRAAANDL
jgi:flagellar biosynthesis/type III secretory pathway M-ring protein FliF/YscJ